MRIGVLGGSFNPPHTGHLIIASDAFETLTLDRLFIVPARVNPLKGPSADGPTAEQRMEMVRLTFGDDPRFEVSSMEIERGGLSYTVDTLEALKGTNKEAELILLLGMDSLKTMPHWKHPERIAELATLAVLARGDASGDVPPGMTLVTTRRIDVSSTEIRERLRAGRAIKGFVAESVERYISAAALYKHPSAG